MRIMSASLLGPQHLRCQVLLLIAVLGLLSVAVVVYKLHLLTLNGHQWLNVRVSNRSFEPLKAPANIGVFQLLVNDGLTPVSISTPAHASSEEQNSGKVEKGNRSVPMVPNVVYYIWFGDDLTFSFVNYLSFRSVDRFIQPGYIFVFGETVPKGSWWLRAVADVCCIYHVRVERPKVSPNGKKFKHIAHSSDFLRFNLLSKYGGIYLDSDVLILKSFDALRRYDMVMGREQPDALCNGIMLARRGAQFLKLILELYESYLGDREEWGWRANRKPHYLALDHPNLIHVEEESLDRPNWKESAIIYKGLYNWTSNYALHLWTRTWPQRYRPRGIEDIKEINTTLGQISRLILHGTSQPLF